MRLRGMECGLADGSRRRSSAANWSRAVDGSSMKVLVTGHHGYIGSVLAPLVADAGHDVVGLDLISIAVATSAPAPTERRAARDIRDVTAGGPDGFDAVVHLAALSNDPLGDLNPGWTYRSIGTAPFEWRRAKEAGVGRFVFASSCSMYGASGRRAGSTRTRR